MWVRRYIDNASKIFFFNDTATTEIYTLSLHDALPIWTLKTNSGTIWELGTADAPAYLDLSGGTLELGGDVTLDNILTNNQTKFKLGEDATVTRNQSFTLGGVDFTDYTFTLGTEDTDLTLDLSAATGDSPTGTLATQAADLTILGAPTMTAGTIISSTGGTFTFGDGLSISGATLSLTGSTLALGGSFSNTGGTLTLSGTDLELLSDVSLSSDSAAAFDSFDPKGFNLELKSTSTGNVALGTLALTEEKIEVNGGTLSLAGGSVGTNGELEVGGSGTLSLQGDLTVTGTLNLSSGASLKIGRASWRERV